MLLNSPERFQVLLCSPDQCAVLSRALRNKGLTCSENTVTQGGSHLGTPGDMWKGIEWVEARDMAAHL